MSDSKELPAHTLPDTKLKITSSELTKSKKRGGTSRWDLAKIEDLRITKSLNPFSIGILGSACGILYLRSALALSTWLAIPLYLFVGLLAIMGALMITSPVIRFKYPGQGTVSIACEESQEVVQEFVESIQHQNPTP